MLTIKKLSSTGFQTMNNTWYSVDVMKILKNKKFPFPFESLKVGDRIDNLKFQTGKNNKEYVIDFIVLPHEDIGVKENTNSPLLSTQIKTSLNSSPSPINIPISSGSDVLERESMRLNPRVKAVSTSVQDSIRYAQCVNIAFDSIVISGFDDEDRAIKYAFDRADKIYIEFSKRLK